MVFTLDLEIDFDRVSAANFGAYLPNLKHMRLSHSNIRSVRENKSEYHLATGAIIEAGRSTLGLKPTPLLKQKRISQFTRSKNNCVTSTLPRSPSEIINSEVNSDEEGRVSELTTGKIICGGISAALRNRRSSTQTGAVGKPKSACLTSEGKSSVTLPLDKSGGWKSDESLDPNESDMQHADKAVAVECENILKQEFDIQKECDIVFKELAEWRKLHSDSKLFNSNKKVENSKQHLAKRVTGCDADLSSTKSNKTTDSCLNVQHDCRSNIVTSNKPLNNSNQILNGHKNCLVNSIQNQNHKNTVSVEMLSSTGKSQIL
ncbi:Leucine-rich repeat-containing protein [Schistosoma japonicum]|nr:Leucine-rich repeat-containing protein [Schistosoma japonicum]